MNQRWWTSSRAAFAALLLGGGALAANDPIEATQADVGVTKAANLSPQETLTQAKAALGKMQETVRDVTKLQEVAKKQKDIIKLNCVNDKLLQIKGHLAVGDSSMSSLNEAVSKSDDAARQHEFARITILQQKVGVLGTESQNCIGEDLSYVGKTKVDVEVTDLDPNKDETAVGNPTLDASRAPAASSTI